MFQYRADRICSIPSKHPKRTFDVLQHSPNNSDYLVIDRADNSWVSDDQKKLILLKTFAPLSGQIIMEDQLKHFPCQVWDKNGHIKTIKLDSKATVMTVEEAHAEKSLEDLEHKLKAAFECVINPNNMEGIKSINAWIRAKTN